MGIIIDESDSGIKDEDGEDILDEGSATYYQNAGQGLVASIGILSKKTSKDVGGGSVTSIGTLVAATLYTQAVGGASISIIGSLATQFIAGVGGVANFIRRRKTFYEQ